MKKFIIDISKSYIRTAITIMGELVELAAEERSDDPRSGDIYAARVENIVKKQYAFINIGAERNGFMHISDKNIQQGQVLTVQVDKPAVGEKGCALTLELSLSGRLAAVTTDGKPIGISHRITDSDERGRLLDIAKSALPEGFSCVVRTKAAAVSEKDLSAEISVLSDSLAGIIEKGLYTKPPYRLYRRDDETLRLLRDCYEDGDEVIVNNKDYYNILVPLYPQTVLYGGAVPLFTEYGIESCIDKLLRRKVWLDCGGFLIFDYTEAMTVIDVNTGKFTDGGNMRKAALKTNLQAAKEIAKQLRLRNLSGIIIVDFVNMKNAEDIEELEKTLKEAISHDRLKTVYAGMTNLGIAQLTRQKQSVPLHTLLHTVCRACSGSGETKNYRYIRDKVRNQIISLFTQTIYSGITISGSADLIAYLKKHGDLDELSEQYEKSIELKVIETGAADYFETEKRV